MDIRALTIFCNYNTDPADWADFIATAKEAFPLKVQTIRVATNGFPEWMSPDSKGTKEAMALARAWKAIGVNFVSIGTHRLTHDRDWLRQIPFLLKSDEPVFASTEIADLDGNIDIARIDHVARTIKQLSLDNEGFSNLYFTATANCGSGHPFFPVASGDGEVSFALAMESADAAQDAVNRADSLNEVRTNLIETIETTSDQLVAVAEKLSAEFEIPFGGIDFSLAPFPTPDKSIGGAIEQLGLPFIGAEGSLFASAFLTDALHRANFPSCGYSGLMLSVLEDTILAKRSSEGQLTIQDLLSYSAVCGVGLDAVPLPGDITVPQLSAILLDVAALSMRLRKPLCARLMPIPGLKAGDTVSFDFPYFASSKVLPIVGTGIFGKLDSQESVNLNSIHHRH